MKGWVVAAVIVLSGAACSDSPSEPQVDVFEISVETGQGTETFRVRIGDEEQVAEAERLLASGERRNISGVLARGNDGINVGYGWHLVPSSVHFADLTAEVCDGSPSDIDDDLSYWVDTVKQYCPWGVAVTEKVS